MRLGLREQRPQEAGHEGAVEADAGEHRRRVRLQAGRNARRLRRRCDAGIGIATRNLHPIAQVIEKRLRDLDVGGGTKADRVRRALVDRNPVVRIGRRQVQQVAGLDDGVVARREALQDLHRQLRSQGEIALAPVAPAPAAETLQQEDVVGIEMRTDPAAGNRVAHHHVVEARVGDEGEAAQQRVGAVVVQVHALHE